MNATPATNAAMSVAKNCGAAQLRLVPLVQELEPVHQTVDDLLRRPEVPAETPAVHPVPLAPDDAAQRDGGLVRCREAGQHEHERAVRVRGW